MVEVNGRLMDRRERVRALRRGIAKKRRTLEHGLAHCPDPRPRDLARWDALRAGDWLQFEKTLAGGAGGWRSAAVAGKRVLITEGIFRMPSSDDAAMLQAYFRGGRRGAAGAGGEVGRRAGGDTGWR